MHPWFEYEYDFAYCAYFEMSKTHIMLDDREYI